MRYIIRRPKAEEFSDIAEKISDLSGKLGQPAENFRRTVSNTISPMRSVTYKFVAKKVENNWQWACPSIELVGETEADLLALTEAFGVQKTELKHLFSAPLVD